MKFPFKLPNKIEDRNRIVSLLIGLAMAILFSALYAAGPLKTLADGDLDTMFTARGKFFDKFHDLKAKYLPVNEDVTFIEIDDSTLFWEETFPDDPVYYLDILNELGVDNYNALAVIFSIDYSRKFGRKVDKDISEYYQSVFGQLGGMVYNNYVTKKGFLDNLEMLNSEDVLGGPDAANVAGDVAARLEEMVYDQALGNAEGQMGQVSGFMLQKADLEELAPNREQSLATSMEAAGNVYFIYEAVNIVDVPYDVDDLVNDPRVRATFEKVMHYRTLNRPEDANEAVIYDLYNNLTPDELNGLIDEKDKPFDEVVIARLKRDSKERLHLLEEFRRQNKALAFEIPDEVKDTYLRFRKVSPVTPLVGEKTVGQGAYKAEISSDGKLRKISPMVIYDGKMYPHLDFLIAMKYLGVTPENVTFRKRSILIKDATHPRTGLKKDIVIPLDKDGLMIVNWAGLWADTTIPFGHKSLKNVYMSIGRLHNYKMHQEALSGTEEEVEAYLADMRANNSVVLELMESITPQEVDGIEQKLNDMNGKIIVIGRTAVGTEDLNPTPLEPRYPVLGLHANIFNTIVEDAFIHQWPDWIVALVFLVLAMILGAFGGLIHAKSSFVTGIINFLFMIFVVFAYASFATYLFIVKLTVVPLLASIILVVFTFLLIFLYRFITEEQEKKKMQGMFGTYVNKEVVDSLIEDPDKLKLGGEWTECTVFFSDVAGFTSISESMPPEDLVDLLNEYLTAMTDIVFEYGGTLDKYIGDAIVAIFGAPIPFPENDHAKRACLATIDMQEKLEEMRGVWRERGTVELTARCGVNTGRMIAGNMGSTKRFNYTLMGENCEYGEHLESGGKKWGTVMTISEPTFEQAKDHLIVRMLDVDWKEGVPIGIYEIMARKEVGVSDEVRKGIDTYEAALALYFKREWDAAIEKFNEVYNYLPDDTPTGKAIGRCEDARENAPEEEFDKREAHVAKATR